MMLKTADLCGRQLDYAVQMVEIDRMAEWEDVEPLKQWWLDARSTDPERFHDDWLRTGEIIDREKISVVCAGGYWFACICGTDDWIDTDPYDEDCAPSAIFAALRCYVNYWFGEEVEIPDSVLEKL